LEVVDAQGGVVNTLTSKPDPEPVDELAGYDGEEDPSRKPALTTEQGINRAVWDLTYKGATKIKKAQIDSGNPNLGPLGLPGTYTLKLTAGGKTVTTTVVVQPDPRVKLSDAEMAEQLKLALSLRDDITRVAQAVHRLRSVRQQLAEKVELLKGNAKAEPVVKEAEGLIAKLDALEGRLHNPKAQVAYDILAMRGGAQLYSKLVLLYGGVRGSDGPPPR